MEKIRHQFSLQAIPFSEFKAHSEALALDWCQQIGQFSSKDVVLDVGCGPGLVALHLAATVKVKQVVGIDLTQAMIEKAKANAETQGVTNVSFQSGDMSKLPFADNTFDGVVTRYTFHHLQDPAMALKEMIRVTKPNGLVVVCDATPVAPKQAAYNRFEKLRDPSHTCALTPEQLLALGDVHKDQVELLSARTMRFTLPLIARDLLDKAFPELVTKEELYQMLLEDEHINSLDFAVGRDESHRLTMSFPKTAAGWRKR